MLRVTYLKRKGLGLFDIAMYITCVFPIATMLVDTGFINKMLFALLVVASVLAIITSEIKANTFIKLFVFLISFIYVLGVTKYPIANTNLFFYFPFFIFYTYILSDRWEKVISWLSNNRGTINFVVICWSVLVGISIFLPTSYHEKEGGALYFGSFVGSIFRLGPTAVFIQVFAIVLQVFFKQRKAILYMILPLFCCFMGSSRSYLVVGLLLFLISWYLFCANKKTFNISLIPLGALVLFFVAETSIGAKIAYTLDDSNYGDFWFRVSSSRSELWTTCMTEWTKTDALNKLFGNGLGFTYELTGLWAHNDYIEILCSFGLFGLFQYFMAMYALYKAGPRKRVKMPFVIKASVFMVWAFNAFFNMHYTYFCAMLCYPFLVFTLKYHFDKKGDKVAKKPDLDNGTMCQKNIAPN